MRTTVYEPFGSLRRLQDEMNRAFGSALTANDETSASAVSRWIPAVDVYEEQDNYVIVADVPGVQPESINVTLENGVLSISGERNPDANVEKRTRASRVERVFGTFHRRFTLPDTADAERVEARCALGVLEVTIPKKAAVQPKRIKVGN